MSITPATIGEREKPGTLDHNGFEVLSRDDCLTLLGSARVGRVAVSMRALPVILPVHYAMLDDDIIFRTGTGARLAACSNNSVVAFETDAIDPGSGGGWSVCITGMAHELRWPDELRATFDLSLGPLATGPLDHFIRIRSDIVTGRRTARPTGYGTPSAAPFGTNGPIGPD